MLIRPVLLLILFTIPLSGVLADETLVIPGYDNAVKASSSVANMEDVTVESSLKTRFIAEDAGVPESVRYTFSLKGLNGSQSGARGMARTEFVIRGLEARNDSLNVSGDFSFHDSTGVVGNISELLKVFSFDSGIRV